MDKYTRKVMNNKLYDYATQDMANICESHIMQSVEELTDEELMQRIKAYEEDGFTHNYDILALLRAEYLGVYNYKVKDNKMVYISYFGREGFVKVIHNLDTSEETRKVQATTKLEYNYFVG